MELQNYEFKRADLVNRFKQKLSEKPEMKDEELKLS